MMLCLRFAKENVTGTNPTKFGSKGVNVIAPVDVTVVYCRDPLFEATGSNIRPRYAREPPTL